jgi:hypothetical protein
MHLKSCLYHFSLEHTIDSNLFKVGHLIRPDLDFFSGSGSDQNFRPCLTDLKPCRKMVFFLLNIFVFRLLI